MRKILLLSSVIFVGLIFIVRLYYLQIHTSDIASFSDDNAIKTVYNYPKRGYVYDRNGNLLVANQPSYDVMIIPREVKPLDTLEFSSLLKITKEDFKKRYEKAYRYSPRLPSPLLSHLSKEDYALLAEKMRKYSGFYIQKRSLREYQTNIGANLLGDIGEVNPSDLKKDNYYKQGDLIGKQGIEKSYESILRGTKGIKYVQKDRLNRDIGPYKNGEKDILSIPGKDITITIDSELQAYGELLMRHKRGGIIALDPNNGEILAMISTPTYNPNDLVGRERSKNFTKLYNDTISKPLYDRGLQAMYAPGSPFKSIVALAALQEGVIDEHTSLRCTGAYHYGGTKPMACHCGHGRRDLNSGITHSCNSYFADAYRKTIDKYEDASEGMNIWNKHIESFGLGNYLSNDLSVGQPGLVPDGDYYDKWYPDFRWRAATVISNAIGQGEVLATPIQLANMAAAIANRGHYYTPHIIKNIKGDTIPAKFTTPKYTTIDKHHFEPVIEGMFGVYNNKNGTAATLRIPGIDICGKTGTAENFTKIDGEKVQLTDHSIFVAFAPKDDPKIAIAVFVENGYWGSRFAGRMASLMIEKHIKGQITRTDLEQWIFTHSLENEYAKPYLGLPFKINGETILQTIDNYSLNENLSLKP